MAPKDNMTLLNICQKVDELKINFLEIYERSSDNYDGDQSGVDLSKASSEE